MISHAYHFSRSGSEHRALGLDLVSFLIINVPRVGKVRNLIRSQAGSGTLKVEQSNEM